jgi:hypothetical protein
MNCESRHTPLNEQEYCSFVGVIANFCIKTRETPDFRSRHFLNFVLSPNLIIFTRVVKAASGRGQIRSVRPSVDMHGTGRPPPHGFSRSSI